MDPNGDPASRQKRNPLRRVLKWLGIGLGLLLLFNVLFPDLDLSSQEKVAVIRIEG